MNGGTSQLQKAPEQDVSREFLYVSDFQFTLEETLDSFQKSVCEDMRNLHIEILRQFNMQAMEMSTVTSKILANQAEVWKKLISLERKPAASAIFLALVKIVFTVNDLLCGLEYVCCLCCTICLSFMGFCSLGCTSQWNIMWL